jgi:hypothetical protein
MKDPSLPPANSHTVQLPAVALRSGQCPDTLSCLLETVSDWAAFCNILMDGLNRPVLRHPLKRGLHR